MINQDLVGPGELMISRPKRDKHMKEIKFDQVDCAVCVIPVLYAQARGKPSWPVWIYYYSVYVGVSPP